MKIVSDNADNLNEMDYNLTQPVILLADDPYTLQKVFSYASQYGLDRKAVLAGDGRINIQASDKLEIIFTGSVNMSNSSIRSKASRIGVRHVGFMHELAYDAGRLVAENVSKGYNHRNFIEALKNTNFEGLSGRLHFTDSIAQRNYDVIKKKGGNFSVLNNNSNVESTPLSSGDENDGLPAVTASEIATTEANKVITNKNS